MPAARGVLGSWCIVADPMIDLDVPHPITGRAQCMLMAVSCPACDGTDLAWLEAQTAGLPEPGPQHATVAVVGCSACRTVWRVMCFAIDGALVVGSTRADVATDATPTGLGTPEPCRACGGTVTSTGTYSLAVRSASHDVLTYLLQTVCTDCGHRGAVTIVPASGGVWVMYGPAPEAGQQPTWVAHLMQPHVLAQHAIRSKHAGLGGGHQVGTD